MKCLTLQDKEQNRTKGKIQNLTSQVQSIVPGT